MTPVRTAPLFALLSLLVVSGCGPGQSPEPGPRDAENAREAPGRTVAASVYPLSFLAQEAAGSRAVVLDLIKPGLEPHDAELTAGQVRIIKRSDLVLYLGGHFQPAVEQAVRGLGVKALDLLPAAHAEDAERHGAGNDEAVSGPDPHPLREAEPHVHSDPHVWLDPVRMKLTNRRIAARLAEWDPIHAKSYAARAAEMESRLHELDQAYSSGLRDCSGREFMTGHGAFGYLAERYALNQVAIGSKFAESEPTPGKMAKLTRWARANRIRTVFHERFASPASAETIAREIGAEAAVLDSIEAPPPSGDYFSAMRGNLRALRRALDCR